MAHAERPLTLPARDVDDNDSDIAATLAKAKPVFRSSWRDVGIRDREHAGHSVVERLGSGIV